MLIISSMKKASTNSSIRTSKFVSQNLSFTLFMSVVTVGGIVIYFVMSDSQISKSTAVALVFWNNS